MKADVLVVLLVVMMMAMDTCDGAIRAAAMTRHTALWWARHKLMASLSEGCRQWSTGGLDDLQAITGVYMGAANCPLVDWMTLDYCAAKVL
jgi:hypothetical protein